jgi:hypothetical protein
MSNKNSNGIYESYGVNGSNDVSWSCGVNGSNDVSWSCGVNWSNGVNESKGVNGSNGVSWSCGVNWSNGVNGSNGVCNCLFITNQRGVADMIFNKQTTKARAENIIMKYREKLNNWKPKYNNAFKLYDAHGKDWKNVDASQIKEVDNKTAWEGMPRDAIDYLKSLPEWDANIFKDITGIDTNEINLSGSEVSVTVNGKTYTAVIK